MHKIVTERIRINILFYLKRTCYIRLIQNARDGRFCFVSEQRKNLLTENRIYSVLYLTRFLIFPVKTTRKLQQQQQKKINFYI